ncbi:hypothetical protein BDA96_02G072900 [Sorghum bicolor]|uniref:Uncharacterized protein n=2 Tax=Sorghum bicolor TaxID=4558 RepID=A0A921RN85_SORBI|nr:hypothetical protein BDA96_02G072900 [Sorghum bicolor]OQU88668.1 hypothetical protein SORBI_3002G071350 [Sorghum bicolor]
MARVPWPTSAKAAAPVHRRGRLLWMSVDRPICRIWIGLVRCWECVVPGLDTR